MKKIQIKLMEGCDQSFVPAKKHVDDAAGDCRSRIDRVIAPGAVELIPLGFAIGLPSDPDRIWEAQVRPRSGLALSKHIGLANSIGTIDQGYRNEVGAIVENNGTEPFEIKRGDRICQIVITSIPITSFEVVNELTETKRGQNGFGSTGVK